MRIFDLGYFKLERFAEIQNQDAFYLSRLKFNVNVYELKQGVYQEVNLIRIKNKMKAGEQKTIDVYIGEEKMHTRLVIEKVPPQVANEKRRKLKTDKQNKRKSISKQRLEFCDVNAYITNATAEQLPQQQVREYYSLRWQIEIIFKAWKSVYRIDKIKKMKLQRFECIHYGTLILVILTTHLLAYCKVLLYRINKDELSELKMFKTIKCLLTELKNVLHKSKNKLLEFLDLLQAMVLRTCVKQQKRGRKTPFQIIYRDA